MVCVHPGAQSVAPVVTSHWPFDSQALGQWGALTIFTHLIFVRNNR